MKEILFRGKTRDGKWIESCSVFMRGELALMLNERPIKEVIKDKNGEPVDVIFSFCSVEKNTVGQFTGLTDKNGKKIFEGDIIQGTITSRWNKSLIRCEIVYKGDCFLAIEKISNTLWEHKIRFAKDIEVIGNSYDNPELLKELQNG